MAVIAPNFGLKQYNYAYALHTVCNSYGVYLRILLFWELPDTDQQYGASKLPSDSLTGEIFACLAPFCALVTETHHHLAALKAKSAEFCSSTADHTDLDRVSRSV